LKYHFAVKRGTLQTIIESPHERLLSKQLGKMEADSIHLVNQKGTEYKVYLKGRQALGEFDMKFTTRVE
jgi:hypothetical protein